MRLLNKKEILKSLDSNKANTLFIDPLLDRDQVGEATVDLRLGYDFQVSILTRRPSINPSDQSDTQRSIESYFQETRRELGERFVVYPNQVVVTTTLEYVSLPTNVHADILTRSSYTRLGIHLSTMVQPAWRGCMSLELFNHGSTPIELVVGSRIVQIRLFESKKHREYLKPGAERKYHGDVRPTVSKADRDVELERLLRCGDND